MNILLSTDNNYVMPTGVLMHSISTYNKYVNYFILTNGTVVEKHKNALKRIAAKYGNSIRFYCLPKTLTDKMPVGRIDQPQHITKAAYNRLFAAEFLPKEVHKIIYLDSDMLVRKPLNDLWDNNLEGYAIGVVRDMYEGKHCTDMRLPYDMMRYGYFNSGMLLINVDYWRVNKCIDKFIRCIEKNEALLTLHDQDVLNVCLHNKLKWLPITYNFQSAFLSRFINPEHFCHIVNEIELYKRDPAIVHFTAEDKPWKIEVFHTYTKEWRRFFFMSEWKHERLQGEVRFYDLRVSKGSFLSALKCWLRNYLVRHCLYTPASIYYQF